MQSIDQVPEHLRGELMIKIEQMQVADTVRFYNDLAETCFNRCVTTFHGRQLEDGEEKCVKTCATKFMNLSKRVGQRWQEHQAEMSESNIQNIQSMAAATVPTKP